MDEHEARTKWHEYLQREHEELVAAEQADRTEFERLRAAAEQAQVELTQLYNRMVARQDQMRNIVAGQFGIDAALEMYPITERA